MDPQHDGAGDDHGRRELRVMVITMGGYRKQVMKQQLVSSASSVTVTFVDGVPSRGLRNRSSFLRYCNQAGLLPSEEWDVLEDVLEANSTVDLSELLRDVPVQPGRRGSAEFRAMHYAKELWCKAKALNRGRAVLACTLAHLIALRRFTEEQFDVLLEDNVRLDRDWFSRVLELQRTKELYEREGDNNKVHMLYFGWLGSVPNLEWLYAARSRRGCFQDALFSFPGPSEIEEDLASRGENPTSLDERKPGGNPVWGCYGYWISKEGYESVLAVVRNDVGSLLWKRKRQRYYNVKPIDKILPRKVHTAFGPCSVQLPVRPLAYRAPMLTSKIHTQFDPDFCRSTAFQLGQNGLDWSDLDLTDTEKSVVAHWRETGQWKTPMELGLL